MRGVSCSPSALGLLQSVAGIARAVGSLYGPGLAHKLINDAEVEDEDLFTADAHAIVRSLHSENAAGAVLLQTIDSHKQEFATGGATIVNLGGALAEAVVDLSRRGYPVASIQAALAHAEKICIQTITQMQLPLEVVIPNLHKLAHGEKLEALATLLLETEQRVQVDECAAQEHSTSLLKGARPLDCAASVAVEVLSTINEQIGELGNLLTTHCVHGSCSIRPNTRVMLGVLVPVELEHSAHISWRLKDGTTSATGAVFSGAVALDCDLLWSHNLETALRQRSTPWDGVQVVFVSGTVASQVMDFCSSRNSMLCIPVPSTRILTKLARISGASVAEAWEEVLPESVGPIPLSLSTIQTPVAKNSRWYKEDELSSILLHVDRYSTRTTKNVAGPPEFPPLVSVLIQTPTRSQSAELHQRIERAIGVLSGVLQSSQGVIPAAGSYLCAIASVISCEASSAQGDGGVQPKIQMSGCLSRIADALRTLCVLLLENYVNLEPAREAEADESFLARLAVVRMVEKQFAADMEGVGTDKFFASYNFKSSDYCALRTLAGQNQHHWRADDAAATEAAMRRSFRVVRMLTSIESYEINSMDSESKHGILY